MQLRVVSILAAAFLCLAPAASRAQLIPYSQNFESMVQTDPGALAGDGWLVFANVFDPGYNYLYGYGPFPAPNNAGGFCGLDVNQGGPEQGLQQLVVYSNYNDGVHSGGLLIESNTFRERVIGAADVGSTWIFQFDAKRGNIAGTTTALAFIKTLDPNAGYATTNFITTNMTSVPDSWGTYSVSIQIGAPLVGQILQYGFNNTTTFYQGSGIFYDNLSFTKQIITLPVTVDITPSVINVRSKGPWVTAYIELSGRDLIDIDLGSLRLAGSVPADPKYGLIGDYDADNAPDLAVRFSRAAVASVLSPGMNTVALTGSLYSGENISGSDEVRLIDPTNNLAASVSPNPLNPAGVLAFRTSRPGPVSVRMFDLNGRLVRTLVETQILPAGSHEFAIDGRGAGGSSLPSGVYFYRVDTTEGPIKGNFTVLK